MGAVKQDVNKNNKVELTKIHYHNSHVFRNTIPTISENFDLHGPLREHPGVYIKRNIFGHSWVLNVNDDSPKRKMASKLQIFLYTTVTLAIIVAFSFGLAIYFTKTQVPKNVDKKLKIIFIKNLNETNVHKEQYKNENRAENTSICLNCTSDEVCLQNGGELLPKCFKIKDHKDPTGCGGLCRINQQYCRLLDRQFGIRACLNTRHSMTNCKIGQFKCNETFMCISGKKRCNGIIDCYDKSDEKHCPCNLSENFRCGLNLSCIPNSKKCDGSVDCWDASDEKNCSNKCPSEDFACYNGQCISKDKFCDGIYDCFDKSDEPNGCKNCTESEYRCGNGKCLSYDKYCDGIIDCDDNTDEPNDCTRKKL